MSYSWAVLGDFEIPAPGPGALKRRPRWTDRTARADEGGSQGRHSLAPDTAFVNVREDLGGPRTVALFKEEPRWRRLFERFRDEKLVAAGTVRFLRAVLR